MNIFIGSGRIVDSYVGTRNVTLYIKIKSNIIIGKVHGYSNSKKIRELKDKDKLHGKNIEFTGYLKARNINTDRPERNNLYIKNLAFITNYYGERKICTIIEEEGVIEEDE